jgi:MFS family permease
MRMGFHREELIRSGWRRGMPRLHWSGEGTFAALQVPNFRRYIGGQSVSLVGTWMETVAQALLVLRLGHSGTVLGLMTALRFAPALVLSPYGGVLADRFPKRRLLMVTQVCLAVVSLALGLLVVSGAVRLWEVGVLATAFGVVSAIDNPARLSIVGEIVGRERLRNAVTLNTTMVNLARAVGPALAGVLVVTVGIGACFLINAASFAAVVWALATLDARQLHAAARNASTRGPLREGLRYARGRPEILAPLLMMTLIGTFTYEFEVTLPLLARNTFGTGATGYSWLLSSFGIGAVAGAIHAAKSARTGVRPLTAAAAAFAIATAAAALAPTFWVEVALVAVVGATSVTFLTTGNSTVQLAAAPEYRGRITALWSTAFVGTTPIGAAVVGVIADDAGPRWSLALGSVACAAAGLVGLELLRRHPSSARAGPARRRSSLQVFAHSHLPVHRMGGDGADTAGHITDRQIVHDSCGPLLRARR